MDGQEMKWQGTKWVCCNVFVVGAQHHDFFLLPFPFLLCASHLPLDLMGRVFVRGFPWLQRSALARVGG